MFRLDPQPPVRFPTPEEVASMPLAEQRVWFERILGASVGAVEYEEIESCCRCDGRLDAGDYDYCQRCLAADYEQTSKLMGFEDAQARKTLKSRASAR